MKIAMTLSLWETLKGLDPNRSGIGTSTTIRWYEKGELNFPRNNVNTIWSVVKLDATDC